MSNGSGDPRSSVTLIILTVVTAGIINAYIKPVPDFVIIAFVGIILGYLGEIFLPGGLTAAVLLYYFLGIPFLTLIIMLPSTIAVSYFALKYKNDTWYGDPVSSFSMSEFKLSVILTIVLAILIDIPVAFGYSVLIWIYVLASIILYIAKLIASKTQHFQLLDKT